MIVIVMVVTLGGGFCSEGFAATGPLLRRGRVRSAAMTCDMEGEGKGGQSFMQSACVPRSSEAP